jgi:hypothetical protein
MTEFNEFPFDENYVGSEYHDNIMIDTDKYVDLCMNTLCERCNISPFIVQHIFNTNDNKTIPCKITIPWRVNNNVVCIKCNKNVLINNNKHFICENTLKNFEDNSLFNEKIKIFARFKNINYKHVFDVNSKIIKMDDYHKIAHDVIKFLIVKHPFILIWVQQNKCLMNYVSEGRQYINITHESINDNIILNLEKTQKQIKKSTLTKTYREELEKTEEYKKIITQQDKKYINVITINAKNNNILKSNPIHEKIHKYIYDYKICKQNSYEIETTQMYNIQVMALNGLKINVLVHIWKTVNDLKYIIENKIGIPSCQQQLINKETNKILNGDDVLKDSDIYSDICILLSLKM